MVLINGPFGIGKTSAARELLGLLPHGLLFDPEEIGSFLRRLLGPLASAEDYQELPLWRSLTVALALRVQAATGRDLVVPMTIWRPDHFAEITAGPRAGGTRLTCVRLIASRETLRARILGRAEEEGPHAWCLAHLESGLAAANDPAFGIAVQTDGRTPREVAAAIARLVRADA